MSRRMLLLLACMPLVCAWPAFAQESVVELPRADAGHWHAFDGSVAPEGDLGELYGKAVGAYRAGDLLAAKAQCFELLQAHPDYPPALLLLGMDLYRLQQYGQAILAYERLLNQQPSALTRTRQLGHCYYSVGQSTKAIAHFDRILEAKPTDWIAQRSRAVVLLRTGDWEGARRDLDAVRKEHPSDPHALYWMAFLEYDLEDLEPAMALVEKARAAAPFDPRVWYLQSQILLELEQGIAAQKARVRYQELLAVETAVRRLQGLVLRDPQDLDSLEQVGRMRLLAGDLQRAESAYERLRTVALRLERTDVADRAQRSLLGIRQVR